MNRFAELLDALLFTPSRNGKLRLMQEYFATTPDPERGWALAALTGELSFAEAKPAQVRDLAMARVDPELFGWSWDFVGDLAETVALIFGVPAPFDARCSRKRRTSSDLAVAGERPRNAAKSLTLWT